MKNVARAVLAVSLLVFVGAVFTTAFLDGGRMLGIPAEAQARAATYLALLAIGIAACWKDEGAGPLG